MSHMKDLAIGQMNELKEGDEVEVCFRMKITGRTTSSVNGQLFGFTPSGMCVSAPMDSVVARG